MLALQNLLRALPRPAPRSLSTFNTSFRDSLLQTAETRISTLPNGMRVATESMDGAMTATVGVWIDVGSRYETPSNNGVAHFLEHLAFKGTKRRSRTMFELEIENMGAHLNAYTSREQTVYYSKVLNKDVPVGVDIISDILQNSLFDPYDIECERGVILREMTEVNKEIKELIFDELHAIAFKGGSLGRTILGPEENIKSIKDKDLWAFIKQHYIGPRMVLAAAGGVDHDQLVQLAQKSFGRIPPGEANPDTQVNLFHPSEKRIPSSESKDVHIAYCVEGPSFTSPDYFPVMIMHIITGSWDRAMGGGKNLVSSFARKISQDADLYKAYTTFLTNYTDTGMLGFYLIASKGKGLDQALLRFQREWYHTLFNVTEEEVEMAKHQLKTLLLLQLDGTTAICEDIGRQLLTFGKRISLYDANAMVDRVDAATVKAMAAKYLGSKQPSYVVHGDVSSLPRYEDMCENIKAFASAGP